MTTEDDTEAPLLPEAVRALPYSWDSAIRQLTAEGPA